MSEAVDKPATLKTLWSLADLNVKATRSPRDFNQSVMELGALICTPKNPTCLVCPLKQACVARETGRVEVLPVKTPKKKPLDVTHRVLAIQKENKFLFVQRPSAGLWSNMWQMPTDEEGDEEGKANLAVDLGLKTTRSRPVTTFVHQTTHRTVTFEVSRAKVTGNRLKPKAGLWRRLNQLDDLPLAKPQQKVVAALLK